MSSRFLQRGHASEIKGNQDVIIITIHSLIHCVSCWVTKLFRGLLKTVLRCLKTTGVMRLANPICQSEFQSTLLRWSILKPNKLLFVQKRWKSWFSNYRNWSPFSTTLHVIKKNNASNVSITSLGILEKHQRTTDPFNVTKQRKTIEGKRDNETRYKTSIP